MNTTNETQVHSHFEPSLCCGVFVWSDGQHWRCGTCDAPPAGHDGPRVFGAAVWAAIAAAPPPITGEAPAPATKRAPSRPTNRLVLDAGYVPAVRA